ncbi:hypothetical protein MTY_1271 [Moorella thermoacetica Y72]|uniref:Uncharacterized protein n=1 Tax=Moorella thermoacetica Y72 TaxID=1325331 RepID=A0A0S6UEB2_NEOTH|nr:hypothetical protein MTY_1271 [Moorella thermoacetica Y72]
MPPERQDNIIQPETGIAKILCLQYKKVKESQR